MTRRTYARIAGFTFLIYIVTGIASMILSGQAMSGAEGTAAKLASLAQHETLARVNILLGLLQAAYALLLGVSLYALTRDQDHNLAVMALSCRLGEGLVSAVDPIRSLGLLTVAAMSTTAASPDAAANILGDVLLKAGSWTTAIAATCFAVGSAIFSYLFLRARSIPTWMAWLGIIASVLLVLFLPFRLAGFIEGPVTWYVWLPMLVFELVLAYWLIFKGVAEPTAR